MLLILLLEMKTINFKDHLIIFFSNFFFAFLCFSCRWKIIGKENLDNAKALNRPIFLPLWHGRFLFVSYFITKWKYSSFAIAGHHRDASRIASILSSWGFKLIRGSSSKGGKDVIKKMMSLFKNNETICITSDGPKGPIHIAKPGSIKIAMESNAIILPVTGIASKFWKINSWDNFILPKPFGTIYFKIGKKIDYNINKISSSYCSDLVSKHLNLLQQENDLLIK